MKKLSDLAISFTIFLFIISFSVVVTLNFKQLYYINVDSQNLSEQTGISRELIIENYDRLIDYNSIFNADTLEFENLAMSNEGRIHFEEVKNIFVSIQIILIISALITVIAMYFKIKKKDFKFIFYSSLATITIPLVLGIIIAINWQWCFVMFHKIAFRNDYWIFDPLKDPVITLLPNSFFMQCSIMIISIILILSAILFVLWKILKKPVEKNADL